MRGRELAMSETNQDYISNKTGLSKKEWLIDRLKMNIAFCKRYRFSVAVCTIRVHLPDEIQQKRDQKLIHFVMENVSARLTECVRDIDTIAKMNDRDYVLLLTDVTEFSSEEIVERILDQVAGVYTFGDKNISISVNLGLALYPYGGNEPQELLTNAKMEMFVSEKEGKNKYSFYKGDIDDDSFRKAIVENDLQYAIKTNQFEVCYQPQFQYELGKTTGIEALIRWRHPKLGIVSPIEFLGIAERNGDLPAIFSIVLRDVCATIRQYKENKNKRDLRFSINISVHQLLAKNFISDIKDALVKEDIDPRWITFEITEDVNIYNEKKVIEKIQNLKQIGITIALDDFGNGYFSFADLIELPVDYLKFDREFVLKLIKNNKLKSVIAPIIQMSHNLGHQVVIEGVENEKQFKDWKELNCDIVQGYVISKPLRNKDLFLFLENNGVRHH